MVGKLTPDNMISASRIPALLGLSPYATPNELLSDVRAIDAGEPRPSRFDGNEATEHGDNLEPYILETACKRLGITEYDICLKEPYFHDKLRLAASLDGMGVSTKKFQTDTSAGIYCPYGDVQADGWGCLEAKLTSAPPEDQAPAARGLWQLQAQMMCAGFKWGAIATFYRGIELRVFMYEANAVMQTRIAEAITEFERRRESGEIYPVLSSDDGNHAFHQADEDDAPLDLASVQGGSKMALDLAEAKQRKDQAEYDIDMIEASIKEVMGKTTQAFAEIGDKKYVIKWPMRKMRAQPEKITPAKPERVARQKTLSLKVIE